ncbi:MAG: methyltransferase domain-containing protein [Acidobacteria bacterium]|nr:methyltransferase domain-containing protein [Acidobacteriota bacterium]
MSVEFTGERVIPGEVDVDLWNEHIARYVFASRLARRKRTLDIGCGAGYGSAELAANAAHVTGVDISDEAVAYASEHYQRSNLSFQVAPATALPFDDGSFDLVVAFEVIEHLDDWQLLLAEARRVLASGGQFVVSTPNKAYYAESRAVSGPNPFHAHEFEFGEFKEALEQHFPHTLLFTENHSDTIVFRPAVGAQQIPVEVRLDGDAAPANEAHFYIAVCAAQPMTGAPAFLYVPTAANVLREREIHIHRLERELETKDSWLGEARSKHAELVRLHDDQTLELRKRNEWALELNTQVKNAGLRIDELQQELSAQQLAATEAVEGYEAEIGRISGERTAAIKWGQEKEAELLKQLEANRAELSKCVALLQSTEATVEERTKWAQALDAEIANLRQQLEAIHASKWLRLGRRFGVGPQAG